MNTNEGSSPQRGAAFASRSPNHRRQFRLVPAAITPLEFADIAAGSVGQLRETGRDRFRRDLESFLGAERSATYTSFRRTLAACFLELADSADDDRTEVLIPAFCSTEYPEAIEGVGLNPVRYDVDPETLSCDRETVAAGLDRDPLAVVAVNVLGYSSPMADLADRCTDRDVRLVEALGYAIGTEYKNRRLGTFGDCAVLNFQQGKPIPVGGGMVVSQDPSLAFDDAGRPTVAANWGTITGYTALSHPQPYYAYSVMKRLLDRVDWLPDRPTTHPESASDIVYAPPFTMLSHFQGEIAHRVFQRLPEYRKQRARTADFYASTLADCPSVRTLTPVSGLSNHQYIRFPLLAETEHLRDRLQAALIDAGIQATVLYDWPVIDEQAFPGAGHLQHHSLTLPTHPYVDERDRQAVVEIVRKVAGQPPGTSDATDRPVSSR